jgi:hypothetical protein
MGLAFYSQRKFGNCSPHCLSPKPIIYPKLILAIADRIATGQLSDPYRVRLCSPNPVRIIEAATIITDG